MVDAIAGALAIAGSAFVLLAGIGALRFPDLYSRMHAATKAPTLGFLLVAISTLVVVDEGRAKLVIAIVVIFVTAAVAVQLVGRSANRAHAIETRLDADDDLGRVLDEQSE